MNKILQFIQAIAEPRHDGLFNPWSQSCPTETSSNGWKARQLRLQKHLECRNPKLIICGEAPGYQGCRYSGIAFTSERLLLEGVIPRVPDLLGHRITQRNKPWSEPSATIVWKALYEMGITENTVMFNAVPWHPEGKNGPHSNRTPTPTEKQLGQPFLKMFLEMFDGIQIAALGNTASGSLIEIGINNHHKLRHPANGGATEFRNGLAHLLNNFNHRQ